MAKTRQWSLLTAVAVVAVLAAGWFLVISPKHAAAGRLRTEATAASGVNDTLRVQISALTAQALKLPQQRARLAVLAAKIPDNPALPTLIRTLRDAAEHAGVDLVSLQPGAPAAFTPGAVAGAAAPVAPGTAAGGSAAAGAGQLLAIPVTVQVSGGFYQLEQFLTNLEDMPRSFLIGQLTVAPTGGASASGLPAGVPAAGVSGGTSTGALTASITGRVFMATAQPAAVTAAPVAPSAIAR